MSHHPFPWRDPFLAALREMPVVQYACDMVGIERSTAYRRRKDDEDFAQAWEEAMEAGIDRAEQAAFRRGVTGWDEPVIHQGQLCVAADGTPLTVRKHSDAMLALVLKGRRKQVYAERTELTGADGKPMEVDQTVRAARVAQLLAVAKQRKEFSDLA